MSTVSRAFEAQPAYDDLAAELSGLIAGEPDPIANLANMSALIFQRLPDLNWACFYLMKKGELVLGPFQGKPACLRIKRGDGVCGTAVARGQPVVVADVHDFPGHIACDEASRSELVVPMLAGGEVAGVLDLDSPSPDRFGESDRDGCAALVAIMMDHLAAYPGALEHLAK